MLSRLQPCRSLNIVSRTADDSSSVRFTSARLGPAGCGSTRRSSRLRSSSSARVVFKAGKRQLGSGSGPSAAALPPFRWKSGSVQCGPSVTGLRRLLIFLFHGRRAETAGRKGGRNETPGMMGNVVDVVEESRDHQGFKDFTSQHAPVSRRVMMAL